MRGIRRFWCRFVGHGRLRSRPLYEGPTIRYGGGLRDDHGRALAWPECVRCGHQFVVLVGEERA